MAAITSGIRRRIGARLSRYLDRPRHTHSVSVPTDPDCLLACLRPGDVLLVEGQRRVSQAIKYLTQSTWSHAALYVGEAGAAVAGPAHDRCFLEADMRDGVRLVGVSEFAGLHCRVCRPIGLSSGEVDAVIGFAMARLGHQYDLKNVIDLARYLLPTPPVPARWRRRMLALGSGDPTRAICSTLIAQAFQSVRYPILPIVESIASKDPLCAGCVDEIYHVRHHSLFAPRDFDVSPYFEVVKPSLVAGFDPHRLIWFEQQQTDPS
ncbi:MAG: YiiX/YebB-like N1pC/P60 family cysteine hydrolase [Burkholderiaceae bacterium]